MALEVDIVNGFNLRRGKRGKKKNIITLDTLYLATLTPVHQKIYFALALDENPELEEFKAALARSPIYTKDLIDIILNLMRCLALASLDAQQATAEIHIRKRTFQIITTEGTVDDFLQWRDELIKNQLSERGAWQISTLD